MMTARSEFETGKDLVRARLLKFTRRAFKLLPPLDKPCILDIGCGSGVVTMDLAILSNGWITALDINEYDLDRLAAKVRREGLSERVTIVKRSMLEMDFTTESFDMIWSEGSIYVIGFESGLLEWKRLLKPNGFLAIHDETRNIEQKLRLISLSGYDLIEYFMIDRDVWWTHYCVPLQELIDKVRPRSIGDLKTIALLDKNQREIDMFKVYPEQFESTFFVMRKR